MPQDNVNSDIMQLDIGKLDVLQWGRAGKVLTFWRQYDWVEKLSATLSQNIGVQT